VTLESEHHSFFISMPSRSKKSPSVGRAVLCTPRVWRPLEWSPYLNICG